MVRQSKYREIAALQLTVPPDERGNEGPSTRSVQIFPDGMAVFKQSVMSEVRFWTYRLPDYLVSVYKEAADAAEKALRGLPNLISHSEGEDRFLVVNGVSYCSAFLDEDAHDDAKNRANSALDDICKVILDRDGMTVTDADDVRGKTLMPGSEFIRDESARRLGMTTDSTVPYEELIMRAYDLTRRHTYWSVSADRERNSEERLSYALPMLAMDLRFMICGRAGRDAYDVGLAGLCGDMMEIVGAGFGIAQYWANTASELAFVSGRIGRENKLSLLHTPLEPYVFSGTPKAPPTDCPMTSYWRFMGDPAYGNYVDLENGICDTEGAEGIPPVLKDIMRRFILERSGRHD
jgi:hypothetical protein